MAEKRRVMLLPYERVERADVPCKCDYLMALEHFRLLVAKSNRPSQAACFMTRLKGEMRICSGSSPRSQLIN